jgi:hypothetical protein
VCIISFSKPSTFFCLPTYLVFVLTCFFPEGGLSSTLNYTFTELPWGPSAFESAYHTLRTFFCFCTVHTHTWSSLTTLLAQ